MPLAIHTAVGLVLLAGGALVAALAVPLIAGRVKPNRFYGIRTKAALASEPVWYELNRMGGKLLVGYGVALALSGGAAIALRVTPPEPAFFLALGAPVLWLIPLMLLLGFASRKHGS